MSFDKVCFLDKDRENMLLVSFGEIVSTQQFALLCLFWYDRMAMFVSIDPTEFG